MPAKEVGGDLYNFLIRDDAPDKLYFALGDVSGKGVPASLFMAQATRLFRTLAAQQMMPAEIATRINEALSGEDNETGMFVTMFIGLVDLSTGHLWFSNAGHNPPVLLADGKASFIDMIPNAPIGLWPGLEYEGEEIDCITDKPFFVYTDPQWHIIPYFIEQKKKGRIRHLGFSCHANIETLRKFLDLYGDVMEFCQIQLNYLDWTLQKAKAKYDLLTERGIPVWVMEPVRGGKLANLPEEDRQKLAAIRPDESAAAWAFRWLTSLPNVKMILSGMSNLPQMKDNVKTFSTDKPLNNNEIQMLFDIAEKMKDSVPCTACRYCCDGCPMQLDIPMLMQSYNDLHFATSLTPVMQIEALPEEKRPSACIACGACASACPQKIDIPDIMAKLSDLYSKQPSWASMCKERAEEAKRAKR